MRVTRAEIAGKQIREVFQRFSTGMTRFSRAAGMEIVPTCGILDFVARLSGTIRTVEAVVVVAGWVGISLKSETG
jgi:hypothetical protein